MEKKFVWLTALVLVLSGWTWGGEKKEAVEPVKKAAASSANSGYGWGQNKASDTAGIGPKKPRVSAQSIGSAAVPLKTLTTGTEEERRVRIESLVRLGKAMAAKREAEAAAKKSFY